MDFDDATILGYLQKLQVEVAPYQGNHVLRFWQDPEDDPSGKAFEFSLQLSREQLQVLVREIQDAL